MILPELADCVDRLNAIWPGPPLKEATVDAWLPFFSAIRRVQLNSAIDHLAREVDRRPSLKELLRVIKDQTVYTGGNESKGLGIDFWEARPKRNPLQIIDPENNPLSQEQMMHYRYPPTLEGMASAEVKAKEMGWDCYAIIIDKS